MVNNEVAIKIKGNEFAEYFGKHVTADSHSSAAPAFEETPFHTNGRLILRKSKLPYIK